MNTALVKPPFIILFVSRLKFLLHGWSWSNRFIRYLKVFALSKSLEHRVLMKLRDGILREFLLVRNANFLKLALINAGELVY